MIIETRRVEKPWGYEEIWAETDHYVGKILVIRAGQRLSLQHHEVKTETIRVARGELHLEIDDQSGNLGTHLLQPGQTVHIEPGTRHRMKAISDVELLEVSTTELDDVIRHEDDYGRA